MLYEIGAVSSAPQLDQEQMLSPLNVMLIEDNEVDVEILRRAVRKTGLPYSLVVAHDGVEALTILRGNEIAPPLARPDVTLLDLNMPRMHGLEFLDEMRADPSLQDLLVFVLSTSGAARDKAEAYKRNVAGYIVKCNTGSSVGDVLRMIGHYAQTIELPN